MNKTTDISVYKCHLLPMRMNEFQKLQCQKLDTLGKQLESGKTNSLLSGLLGWSSSLSWSSGLGWGGGLLGWCWLGSSNWLSNGGLGLLGSLLLLEVLGEELFVSNVVLLGALPSVLLDVLVDSLSSDSLLGNESLDLWGLVEGLVSSDEFSSDNVLSNIVNLLSKSER